MRNGLRFRTWKSAKFERTWCSLATLSSRYVTIGVAVTQVDLVSATGVGEKGHVAKKGIEGSGLSDYSAYCNMRMR